MSVQRRVTIFLSSPTDVQPEREAAERIVARLAGVYSSHITPSLERWERQFYEANRGFQESIAAMDTFDLVVGIVWKRIGSELPPDKFRRDDGSAFESGTVYEIESALAANRRSEKPSVYVFRKTAAVMFTEAGVEQERQQKQSLDAWWTRIFRDSTGHYVAAANEFSTVEDFEAKFENFLVEWLQQRKYIPRGPVWDVPTLGSPYPGLIAYDRDRTRVFFGRQLAIGQACDELLAARKRDGGAPALFVIGASGSGKSSLVRAGLLPLLVEPGTIPGIDLCRSAVTQPAEDSLAALAESIYAALPELAAGAQPTAAKWARVAAESPEAAADALAWALDQVGEAERRRTGADHDLKAALILLVDQLENLFGTGGQKPFSRALRGLVASGRVWLLATTRSDRYTDLQLDPDLLSLKRDGATYDLPPPGPAEISDIVKGPARAAGLAFAERDGRSLARVLVEALPNADALPLLQMTLSQLFERRNGETLGFEAYDAIGGIEGAIAAHANTVFASATAAVRRELDPLLRMLVSDVSRQSDGTVSFIARPADRKSFETSTARRDLINLFVEGRLLVSDGANIRVAHEALLRHWDLARQSVERIADAELRKARLRTLVAVAAAFVFLAIGVFAWSQQNIAEKQTQLAQAEAQAAAANLLATRASQASAKSSQLGVLLAVEAIQRLRARNLPVATASAQILLDIFKRISGVGLRGHRLEPRVDARGGEAAGAFISAVAISPDSKWIATGDGDGRVVLRQRAKPDVWAELAHGNPKSYPTEEIHSLEFSADSTRLAAGKFGGAIVWEVSDQPREIARCTVDNDYVHAVHFAGGNQWLVTAGQTSIQVWDTGAIPLKGLALPESPGGWRAVLASKGEFVVSALGQVWRWRDQTLVAKLPGFDKSFFSMAVSPQGDKVAIGTTEGEVRVWWLNTKAHKTFDQGGLISSVTFSPDGNSVASASSNRTAKIWDLTGEHKEMTLQHPDEVRSIAFHPSGDMVATAGDNNVRLWVSYVSPIVLGGLTVGSQLAFSPDGSYLVAGGYALARLWLLNELNPGAQVFYGSTYGPYESGTASDTPRRIAAVTGHAGPDVWDLDRPDAPPTAFADTEDHASQVALSRDGKWLAGSGVGTRSYLWDVATPKAKPRKLLASTGYHNNKVLFNRDSSLVAGMHEDGSIILESTAVSSQPPIKLDGTTDPAIDFDFHPAGTNVAAVYRDGTAFLWDVRGTHREQLAGPSEYGKSSVRFADDGKHLALGGAGFIEWRDFDGRSSVRLAAPGGRILTDMAIAPNATLVASGTEDGTTLVWEPSKSIVPRELFGHVDKVISIAFSPDGQLLASATQNSIRVWSVRDLNAAPIRLDLEQVKVFHEKVTNQSSAISSILVLNDRQIAATTGNHFVIVWDLDWDHLVARACETAGRGISATETVDYLDGAPATACLATLRKP